MLYNVYTLYFLCPFRKFAYTFKNIFYTQNHPCIIPYFIIFIIYLKLNILKQHIINISDWPWSHLHWLNKFYLLNSICITVMLCIYISITLYFDWNEHRRNLGFNIEGAKNSLSPKSLELRNSRKFYKIYRNMKSDNSSLFPSLINTHLRKRNMLSSFFCA